MVVGNNEGNQLKYKNSVTVNFFYSEKSNIYKLNPSERLSFCGKREHKNSRNEILLNTEALS